MNRETISVEEVASRLGTGRNSAYAALQRGEIPHIKIGRRYLVPRTRFEQWLLGTSLKQAGEPADGRRRA